MRITQYGPGVSIDLDGDETARAIDAWIVGQGIHVSGPRTVTVNRELIEHAKIYVDPSGFVIADGKRIGGATAAAGSHLCTRGLHRKGILTPNTSKQRWEVVCDACGAVTEWWAYGASRAPQKPTPPSP